MKSALTKFAKDPERHDTSPFISLWTGRRNRPRRGLRPAGQLVLRATAARVARETDNEAIAAEYTTLFGGVGKPEVYLFGSYYLSGFLNEKPLAALRADVAALGLARDESMSETEDHVAYLCEVMRYLIAGDDVAIANLTRQQAFFACHVLPWVPRMCDAVAQHPKAHFYRALAAFTQAFVSVESQGFDMLDGAA
jgi:TorA maturation chaperone TorD